MEVLKVGEGKLLSITKGDEKSPNAAPSIRSLLLGPFLILVLFVGAGLSIPYGFVAAQLQRRRSLALQRNMKAAGRLLGWSDCRRRLENAHGTLIVEAIFTQRPNSPLVDRR